MYWLKRLSIFPLIILSALHLVHCHFFTARFFRQLIPQKRISNATVFKTEAGSTINCNLKCVNKKHCISPLYTISQHKCILLKSFFKDIKVFGETTKNDKSVKVIESRLQDPCFLAPCANQTKPTATKPMNKTIAEVEDFNCQDLKQANKNLTSGYYNVWLDASKKSKIKVFCDMETEGGGWTQVLSVRSNTSNIDQFLKLPFKRWANLTGFSPSGNYMIEPSLLKHSSLVGGKTQMRFQCSLPNKTLHLMTTNYSFGIAVVDFVLGRSDVKPVSCYSYKRLPDDNAYLSQRCSDWYMEQGKWGAYHSVARKNRYLHHLLWINGAGHWNLFENYGGSNRFECDNQRIGLIGKGEFWQIFIR